MFISTEAFSVSGSGEERLPDVENINVFKSGADARRFLNKPHRAWRSNEKVNEENKDVGDFSDWKCKFLNAAGVKNQQGNAD